MLFRVILTVYCCRVSYDSSLSSAGDWVASSLLDTLQSSPSSKLLETAVQCVSKWATSSYLKDQALSDLYPLLLHHLVHAPDSAPVVAACLEDWFFENAGFFSASRLQPLLDLFSGSWFSSVLQSARQENDADETALAYIKLFLCVFEYSTDTLTQDLTSPKSVALLQNMLAIQSFPGYYPSDEQVSNLALNSWEYVQEALAENGLIGTDKPESRLGVEIFQAVVQALRTKVEWADDAELSTWNKGA